jgi:ubiquinone/menaquinone biosynthesis C-methylase UbiE
VISDQLLASVCCPRCHGRLVTQDDANSGATSTWTLACSTCGARYPQHTREYLDLRPQQAFAEQTKYLDEALHADARHERVSTPLLGSGIRQRQLRKFLQLAPGDKVIDLGCGSGRSLLWNEASGATFVGTDVAPYFAKEARDRMPLALGDLRQLPFPDGTFTKAYALDVLEHLSPEALDAMLKEAARILAPGGVLFVYSHVRKNSPLAIGLKTINRFARVLERAGLIDMTQERLRKSDHLNPLRDVPHLEQVVTTAGFSVAKIRYYTPLVGGFVENIMMRMAERAMTKRAARKIAASHTPNPPTPLSPGTSGEGGIAQWAPQGPTPVQDPLTSEAIKQARLQAKARIARQGPVYWALRGLTVAMETDMVLFGRIRTGPFFALFRKEPAAAQRLVDAGSASSRTQA